MGLQSISGPFGSICSTSVPMSYSTSHSRSGPKSYSTSHSRSFPTYFGEDLEEYVRRDAVKNRRIAILEKHELQLELEIESLMVEKQRKNSPVSPPDNRAWFLD